MVKQVLVIRKDIKMRKGKLAAQAAHASMKVFFDRARWERGRMEVPLTPPMYEWCQTVFTKICVYVNSEEELHNIYGKAKQAGLPCALIQDIGQTEFKEPTYTCCAIGPEDSEKIDPITGGLPLL